MKDCNTVKLRVAGVMRKGVNTYINYTNISRTIGWFAQHLIDSDGGLDTKCSTSYMKCVVTCISGRHTTKRVYYSCN